MQLKIFGTSREPANRAFRLQTYIPAMHLIT
jgi:hypothetical protein